MNIKRHIKNINCNYLLIFIYIVVTFVTIICHEPFGDEAIAWGISSGGPDFFAEIQEQGQPFLVYFWMKLLSKAGFSIFSMQLSAWIFMSAAVVFFIFKAPFNLLFKTIFIFNAGMIYYYPVLARSYSFIPLFLFILAYLYPKRHNIPIIYSLLIILLFQTHPYIGGFCLVLSLVFIFELLERLIRRNALVEGVLDRWGG